MGHVERYDTVHLEVYYQSVCSNIQRIPENRKLPILPVCMVLHMDMREYSSFLFSGVPCIVQTLAIEFILADNCWITHARVCHFAGEASCC